MSVKNRSIGRLVCAAVACALSAAVARAAGTFTFVPMTGDFDSTVAPTNAYTHVVDYFKASGSPPVVNGVKFNGDSDAPTGQGNWTLANVANTLDGGTAHIVAGGIGQAVTDFRYGGDANGVAVLTLKGLTPGVSYITNFYNRGWSGTPRNVDLTTSDGGAITFNQDGFGVGNGSRLSYAFTAASNTLAFNFDAQTGDTFHHYAMSNQYVNPAAAPFKTLAVTGDATSGISAARTYTHAVDLNGAADTPVNGVTFVGRGNTGDGGFGKTFTLAGATTPFGGDTTNTTGGIGATLSTFLYGTVGGNSSLTLDGLTPGTQYELSVFASSFGDPGGRFVTVSSDNGSIVYDENFTGDNNGNVLTYLYTATAASQTFTFDPHDTDDTFHWYGFANAVAPVPEPGTASLVVIAAAAAMSRRRRRAV